MKILKCIRIHTTARRKKYCMLCIKVDPQWIHVDVHNNAITGELSNVTLLKVNKLKENIIVC